MQVFRRYAQNRSGTTTTEYALLTGIFAVALIAGAGLVGEEAFGEKSAFTCVSRVLDNVRSGELPMGTDVNSACSSYAAPDPIQTATVKPKLNVATSTTQPSKPLSDPLVIGTGELRGSSSLFSDE